jgi:hypothetical protein
MSGGGEDLHLGFDAEERVTSPYAAFFRPEMAPLSPHVREAVATGALAPELLPPVERAADLQRPGYALVETGFVLAPDGAARIATLTRMPGVAPALWDWWFAWHGSEAQRYKLWHPRAHVGVGWADRHNDLAHYVGRTSHVVEYVGSTLFRIAIRFVPPASLGFDEQRLSAAGEVAICARAGLSGAPMDTGWLVHHLRPVEGGCEMRSRFWIGGANVRPRGSSGTLGGWIGRLAARSARPTATQANELLVHCAQEMSHLAGLLPEIHAMFGERR